MFDDRDSSENEKVELITLNSDRYLVMSVESESSLEEGEEKPAIRKQQIYFVDELKTKNQAASSGNLFGLPEECSLGNLRNLLCERCRGSQVINFIDKGHTSLFEMY